MAELQTNALARMSFDKLVWIVLSSARRRMQKGLTETPSKEKLNVHVAKYR